MKNKVILIQPPTCKKAYPLAPLTLAATLQKENFKPIIIDLNIYDDYLDRIKDNLSDALFVGISVMSDPMQINPSLEISEYVHKLNPKVPVVWGGWYPSCSPTEALTNEHVGIIVRGEGDVTVVNLARALQNNEPLSQIKGIGYKIQGNIVNTPNVDMIADLNSLPYLPWDLIDVGAIIKKYKKPSLQVITGRGCTMACTFCSHQVLYAGHRMFTAKYIFDNMESVIKKFNIEHAVFYEGTCLNSINRVKELCEEILQRGLHIHWVVSSRANVFPYFGADIYRLLKRSGCCQIHFGFESGSQRILNRIMKRQKIKDMLRTISILRKYNFSCEVYFMYNFPFESIIDALKTLLLVCWIKIRYPGADISFAEFGLIPGTKLYEEYKDQDKPNGIYKILKSKVIKKCFECFENDVKVSDKLKKPPMIRYNIFVVLQIAFFPDKPILT